MYFPYSSQSSESGRKSLENRQKCRHQHFYIIKRTLHVGSKIWIFARGKNNISLVRCARCLREILFLPLNIKFIYYMEESDLLGTKPLVESKRHFIRDPSGVFSVCHLCECRIVQWRHDSHLLLLLNWFLHIIKRTLHVGSKIWILCSRGKNNISRAHSWDIVLATRT